jgi:hypothetical protein
METLTGCETFVNRSVASPQLARYAYARMDAYALLYFSYRQQMHWHRGFGGDGGVTNLSG